MFVRKHRGPHRDASVRPTWLASLMLAVSMLLFTAPLAAAETRTLKLFFIHTNEKAEITFKRNGRYDQAGLKKINMFLRDWRRNEPTKMDPRLLDLVWEAYKQTGSSEYIHVVSAYRSPATNGMLRSRSKGVAKKSQHMLGKAMDFYIPGVKLRKLREIGLRMQVGGVGYYPTSGSPFVHFDVGNVRHWPRMSRSELVAVFPNGNTLHVPSDGKPLPGFEQALASYKSRKGGSAVALAAAVGDEEGASSGGGKKRRGLLAAFFGGGADEEEESGGAVVAAAEEAPARVAAAAPKPKANTGGIRILSPDQARPVEMASLAAEEPVEEPVRDSPEKIIAALPLRSIPMPEFAPRPKVEVGAPLVDLSNVTGPLVALEADAAAASPPAVEKVEVASADPSVPLPSRRPGAAPVTAANEDKVATLLAAFEEKPAKASLGGVPMPTGRPADAAAARAVSALGTSDVELPDEVPFPSAPEEVLPQPKGQRMASLGNTGDALGTGVRTTKKSGRPSAADSKPDPKPVVIKAQPIAARWALDTDEVARNIRTAEAPSFAYKAVRTAPTEVYANGFQPGGQPLDAGRFAGKAVTFMSVARFN